MHNIKEIRRDPQRFRSQLMRRQQAVEVDRLLQLDQQYRDLTTELDGMRQKRNSVSQQIGQAKQQGMDTAEMQTEMRALNAAIKHSQAEQKRMEEQIHQLLRTLPNLPSDSTPDGKDAADNVVLSEWGELPIFEFEVKDHLAVAERLGILDFPRGGKVTGSGFPVWSGAGAVLERALINFLLDVQTREHQYREMMTPFLASRDSMFGTGQIPHLEEDMYHCPKDDLFLIPTSEVMLVNLHRDEILPEDQLPIKYAAYSPCFRREAGSWGKDTRGFHRTHQFNKVELVRFEKPEDSQQALTELVQHAQQVLKRLELRHRIVQLCAADLSFQAAQCYDIEVWAPAYGGRWLEVSSCSNCEAFQARRASIRFRRRDGRVEYVHTLNGSGVATSRLMVALLETCQTEEGSLAIPPLLRPYMGGMTLITA